MTMSMNSDTRLVSQAFVKVKYIFSIFLTNNEY